MDGQQCAEQRIGGARYALSIVVRLVVCVFGFAVTAAVLFVLEIILLSTIGGSPRGPAWVLLAVGGGLAGARLSLHLAVSSGLACELRTGHSRRLHSAWAWLTKHRGL